MGWIGTVELDRFSRPLSVLSSTDLAGFVFDDGPGDGHRRVIEGDKLVDYAVEHVVVHILEVHQRLHAALLQRRLVRGTRDEGWRHHKANNDARARVVRGRVSVLLCRLSCAEEAVCVYNNFLYVKTWPLDTSLLPYCPFASAP